MNTKFLSLGGLAIGAGLFLAVNLFSMAALRTARADLTEEKFFTLSQGSKNIVKALDEPVNLYFYFSESELRQGSPEGLAYFKTYAQRVRELLDEYVLASGGRLELKLVDPEPFSEDQDRAQQAGLHELPIDASTTLFFGLVGTNSTDDQEVIPYFNPTNERTLEYDITRLIHTLANPKKKVVGLVSSLPIEGNPGMPMMGMQDRQEAWQIVAQLRQLFEVRSLGTSFEDVSEDVSVLMVVHPKNLSDGTLYAIDQYVLRGGHALVFVDPHCDADGSGQDPSNPLSGMNADKSSDLKKLFEAWGIELVEGKVAADRKNAVPMQRSAQSPPESYVACFRIFKEGMDKQDAVLTSLRMEMILSTTGILQKKEGASIEFTPLLQTSEDSQRLDKSSVAFFPEFKRLLTSFNAEGKPLPVAARLSGAVSSAFSARPTSTPADGEAPDLGQHAEHLAQSKEPINVIAVADVDLLEDRFWIRPQSFGGLVLGHTLLSSNGDFTINAIENLSGSNDLISVRARGGFSRPFDRVDELRKDAEQLYAAKQQSLEQRLRDTEQRLADLQKNRGDQASMILSPEQQEAIKRFQEEMIDTRKELRNVKHDLNKDIEGLGARLKFVNIGVVPAFVALFAVGFLTRRARRRQS